MNSDLHYLMLAIEKYQTQANLADALTWIFRQLYPEQNNYLVSQRRISAWINRDKKIPVEITLPLKLALKRVDITVSLNTLNPNIYPAKIDYWWIDKLNVPSPKEKNKIPEEQKPLDLGILLSDL